MILIYILEFGKIDGIPIEDYGRPHSRTVYPDSYNVMQTNFMQLGAMQGWQCPLCKKIFKPKTCGFWKCEYQFSGKKINDGEVEYYDSKPKETKGDEFEYFDPFGNKEVQWIELNIYVLPKQSVKYQEN